MRPWLGNTFRLAQGDDVSGCLLDNAEAIELQATNDRHLPPRREPRSVGLCSRSAFSPPSYCFPAVTGCAARLSASIAKIAVHPCWCCRPKSSSGIPECRSVTMV